MSILIKIEMPRGCYQCLFMTHCEECEGHLNHCILDEDEHGFGKHLFSNLEWKYPIVPMERPSWCPLIELPPHGDLIDRDALNNAFTGMRFNADGLLLHYGDREDWYLKGSEVETLITNATTIIESEDGDG